MFDVPDTPNAPREAALYRLFKKYALRSELSLSSFIQMCKDTEIITIKFTVVDTTFVFDKTKAIAQSPQSGPEYNNGVSFDKRINFRVFREVCVPCLADALNASRDSVVSILSLDI
jgi:hypothetical protein